MASRLQDVIQRGLASARPAATLVAPGTLYFSTDTGATDRSDGSTWQTYSGGAAPTAHAASHSSGGSDPVTVTNLAGFPGGTTTFLRADGTFAAAGGGSAGADFTNAGNPQGVVTGVGGQTCRDTTNGILYVKRSLASSAYGWYPLFNYGGVDEAACPHQFSWHASPPATSIAGDNIALTGNGINFSGYSGTTLSANRSADSYYMVATTGTGAGNTAGIFDVNFSASRFQWSLYDFDLTFKIRLPAAIADQRIFIGLFSTDPTNADTITGTGVGFRLSSVANAGQWDGVVRDGTTTNVLSSIAAAAVNTAYLLRIRKVGGTVYLSVNNGAEVSTSTNVPSNTNNPYLVLVTFNVSGAGGTARSFQIARLGGWIGS